MSASMAEVLAANGYGKLEDAWDVGFSVACKQWTTQRDDPSHPITRTNPYKKLGNPENSGNASTKLGENSV